MKFLGSLTFAHWSFLVAIIATIATLIGSFVSLKKDLEQAKEDKETEIRRQTEFDSLLNKSINIQKASNDLVKKTDSTLLQQLDILKQQREALDKATLQISKTEEVLKTQSDVLNQQVETITQLTGGDGFPIVIIEISNALNDKMYPVSIHLENKDNYPIQNVEFEIHDPEYLPDVVFGDLSEKEDEKLSELYMKRKDPSVSQFTLPPNTRKLVHRTVLKFNPDRDGNYLFTVNWLKGSYKLYLNKRVVDYIPTFDPVITYINRKAIPYLEGKKYLEIESFITDNEKHRESMRKMKEEVNVLRKH